MNFLSFFCHISSRSVDCRTPGCQTPEWHLISLYPKRSGPCASGSSSSCIHQFGCRALVILDTTLAHCSRSMAKLLSSFPLMPVSSKIPSIHLLLGLPLFLVPSAIPSINCFSRLLPSLLLICQWVTLLKRLSPENDLING